MDIDLNDRLTRAADSALRGAQLEHPATVSAASIDRRPRLRLMSAALLTAAAAAIAVVVWTRSDNQTVQTPIASPAQEAIAIPGQRVLRGTWVAKGEAPSGERLQLTHAADGRVRVEEFAAGVTTPSVTDDLTGSKFQFEPMRSVPTSSQVPARMDPGPVWAEVAHWLSGERLYCPRTPGYNEVAPQPGPPVSISAVCQLSNLSAGPGPGLEAVTFSEWIQRKKVTQLRVSGSMLPAPWSDVHLRVEYPTSVALPAAPTTIPLPTGPGATLFPTVPSSTTTGPK